MNLTNEEAQEINRRVALAMGWRWQEGEPTDDGGGGWIDPMWRDRNDEPTYSSGLFCRDPAAADLVRQEIERRGWWTIIKGGQGAGRWHVEIDIGHPSGMGPDLVGYGDLWTALCLAFLAAHDAKAEDRARAALEATKPT